MILLRKGYVRLRNFMGYVIVNFLYYFRKENSSSNYNSYLSFENDGMCKISLKGISRKIESLLKTKSNEYFDTSVVLKNEFGIKSLAIDLNSNVLWDYVFNDELFEIINSHFKGKFYLRNLPTINFSYDGEKNNAQLFHNDWGLRQLAVMINLMDLNENNTHMEYVEKSNKKYFYKHPVRFSEKFKKDTLKTIEKNKVVKSIGKADSAFVFDAGNGLHRQVSGGKRIIMHMNFTDSLVHSDWSKHFCPEKEVEDYWFQDKINSDLFKKNDDSPFGLKNFSMVLRKMQPKLFTPDVYSSNFNPSK